MSFDKFYKCIGSKKYTTAMLQEFLFPNRKKDSIFNSINNFYKIIENNKIGSYEKIDKENFYL